MYVYIKTESSLWTVGFYAPDGSWHTDSDHDVREDAAKRVAYLNGGGDKDKLQPTLDKLQSDINKLQSDISTLNGRMNIQRDLNAVQHAINKIVYEWLHI